MLSFVLLAVAVICLSLSMHKHFKDSFAKPLSDELQRKLTWAGWIAFALSLPAMPQTGLNYLIWFCQLSFLILAQSWGLALLKNKRRNR